MRLSPVPRTSTTSRSGPRGSWWGAVLTTLLTVGLLEGVVPGPGGQAARADGKPAGTARQAAERAPSFATYNMEGSNRGQRWTGEAGPLTEQHEVLALQEVGSGPPTDAHGTEPESIPISMDATRPPACRARSTTRVGSTVVRPVTVAGRRATCTTCRPTRSTAARRGGTRG